MNKAVIFGTGIITGIVATPVLAMYVKPFRHAIFTGCRDLISFGAKHDPAYRASVIEDTERLVGLFQQLKDAERDAYL